MTAHVGGSGDGCVKHLWRPTGGERSGSDKECAWECGFTREVGFYYRATRGAHPGTLPTHSSSGTLNLAPADRSIALAGGSRQQHASSREETRARGVPPTIQLHLGDPHPAEVTAITASLSS